MATHNDIPTTLQDLVDFIRELRPEEIHVHTLDAADPSPIGWIDFGYNKGTAFDLGMKRIAALMPASIFVVRDHASMAQAVGQLVEVVAAQQAQIDELRLELEQVRKQRVALAAQKNANDVVLELADRGSASESVEVRFTVKDSEKKAGFEQSAKEVDGKVRTDVRGKIGGLMKVLAGLEVKADIRTDEVERELHISHEAISKREEVELTFKVAGMKPPEDPKRHVEAFIQRREFEARQEQTKLSQQSTRPLPSGNGEG